MKKSRRRITRRSTLKLGAAAAALPLGHIRPARAAGRLTIGFWDHWVPAGNAVLRKQIQTWADKNKLEVKVDFITSVGYKLTPTAAAEAQARSGHDALQFGQNHYDIYTYADQLEPVDVTVKTITDEWGPFLPA
ncbi:MAG: ABC transporter substrate-binding protein, partial [Acetobacteraceae bacterium]|nr:ABC transporter substrate-binding protein [Acetobacteraceae bacterium]